MLDIVVVVEWCWEKGDCLEDKMEEGKGEDVYKGNLPVAVNLRLAYQTGDGVVVEDRHVRESLVGATASGVINSRGRGTQGGGSLPN
jgi:hypothetical protein